MRYQINRLEEFKSNGWAVGSSWGLFSKVMPHRVGYQCSSYYRKLLKDGVLSDASFVVAEGDVKFTSSKGPKSAVRLSSLCPSPSGLGLILGIP